MIETSIGMLKDVVIATETKVPLHYRHGANSIPDLTSSHYFKLIPAPVQTPRQRYLSYLSECTSSFLSRIYCCWWIKFSYCFHSPVTQYSFLIKSNCMRLVFFVLLAFSTDLSVALDHCFLNLFLCPHLLRLVPTISYFPMIELPVFFWFILKKLVTDSTLST